MVRTCVRGLAFVLVVALAVPVASHRVTAGVVEDIETTVTLEVTPDPANAGQALTFTATVDAVGSEAIVNDGTVFFEVYGSEVGFDSVEAGVATITLANGLPLGEYIGAAVYDAPEESMFADSISEGVEFTVQPATRLGRFIDSVYRAILFRQVEQAGLDYWTNQINAAGGDRTVFTFWMLFTDEVRRRNCTNFYQFYLERAPDTAGLLYCVALLQQGWQLDDIETTITGSAEYLQLAGGTNDAFLDRLYEQALGRPIDPAARTFYLQRIAAGAPRAFVAATVFHSEERSGLFVERTYLTVLERASDPAGRAYWVGEIMRGTREEALIALLYASNEYFGHIV